MNYIRHLNGIFEQFAVDHRVVPRHISLYMALFQLWNAVRFADKLFLARDETMSLAKIGSVNTYTRTVKELHAWGYIRYNPSHNPLSGSSVSFITFDTSTGYTTDTTADTTTDNTLFINRYLLNNKQLQTDRKGAHSKLEEEDSHSEEQANSATQKKRFLKPPIEEITSYFEERKSIPEEANRFFNHFESNGWKVGGKSPMKDWKAAARNWILNIERYAKQKKSTRKDNYLSAPNVNNYDEPL